MERGPATLSALELPQLLVCQLAVDFREAKGRRLSDVKLARMFNRIMGERVDGNANLQASVESVSKISGISIGELSEVLRADFAEYIRANQSDRLLGDPLIRAYVKSQRKRLNRRFQSAI